MPTVQFGPPFTRHGHQSPTIQSAFFLRLPEENDTGLPNRGTSPFPAPLPLGLSADGTRGIRRPLNTIACPAKELLDKHAQDEHIARRSAEVAELVDALGSGSSWGSPVEVRVFSSAPLKNQGFIPYLQG